MAFLVATPLSLAACTKHADAGSARCFMHGMIVPKVDNKEKTSLSDFLRLHFDVKTPEDKDKCERMMGSYCENNVKRKGYSPLRLKGSFKPDVEKTEETTYRFTENCKLETD
jgi:hypothetical protein